MIRKLQLLIAVCASAVAILGCTSIHGQKFAVEVVPQIREGISTQTDVKSIMGPPFSTNRTVNGDETWQWTYSEVTQAGAYTVMGLVGSSSKSQVLLVTFHNGIVSNCLYTESSHEGKGMSGMIGTGAGNTSMTKCSDLGKK